MQTKHSHKERPRRGSRIALAALTAMVAIAAFAPIAQGQEGDPDPVVVDFNDGVNITVTANVDVHDIVLQLCDGRSIILDATIEENDTLLIDVTAHVLHGDTAVLGLLVFLGIGDQGTLIVNTHIPCSHSEEPEPEPCAPENLTATANPDETILVDWDEATGAGGYNVYRQEGSGEFELVAHVASPDTEYSDANVSVGTSYTYQVTAVFGEDETEPCGEASATAIPVFPTLIAGSMAVLASIGAYGFLRRRS